MTAFLSAHLMPLLLVLLLQSTGLLLLGLRLTRRYGPAVQSLVGRASLASVALLVLLLPLTGHVPPVVRISPPAPILGSRSLEPIPPVAAPLSLREGAEVGAAGAETKGAETKGTASSAPTIPSSLPPTPTTPRPPAPGGQALALRVFSPLCPLWGEDASAALGGFLSVSAALLLWLGVCQWHLTRLRYTSQLATTGLVITLLAELTTNPPRLLSHPSVHSPFLAGYRRPVIFLPASYGTDFNADALRAIFVHELAHRDRRDNLWTLAARLLTALLWPQPLLWLLVRRLEHISEDACDEAVLAQNCPPRAYADCLLSLATRPPLRHSQRTLNAGVAPFRSSVGRRISRILLTKGVRSMSPITLRLRLTAAALTLAAAISGAFLVSSAPAQTTAPTPFVPTPQEQQFITEYKQDLLNLKEIGQANIQYLQDHNEHFPDAARWMDELSPYLKDKTVFLDPFQPGKNRYGYAFNRNCSDKPTSAFSAPSETVVVFDSTFGTKNANDIGLSLRPNTLPSQPHFIGSGYGFADGHAKWIPQGVHPSFSVQGGPMTGLPSSAYPGSTSVLGTWVGPGDGSTRTAMIFRPGGIVEEVGPWPGDPHKIVHSYGRYNERETTLKYILTRVWVEGSPMYTVTPEKHVMDYMLSGDILTIGLKGKYENVYHRSHTYKAHKPKGFLWI